ncbi:1a, partial [Symbiodinium sp. CCMP2456]
MSHHVATASFADNLQLTTVQHFGASQAEFGSWQVRVTGAASEASAALGPGEAAASVPQALEEAGQVLKVSETEATLLTLRLSDEQQLRWKSLQEEMPDLFQKRMSSDNEARWRKLFSAAAQKFRRGPLIGSSAEESGLPLEQTFAATLYDCILEHRQSCGDQAELTIDVLGCRPALELDDPLCALAAIIK